MEGKGCHQWNRRPKVTVGSGVNSNGGKQRRGCRGGKQDLFGGERGRREATTEEEEEEEEEEKKNRRKDGRERAPPVKPKATAANALVVASAATVASKGVVADGSSAGGDKATPVRGDQGRKGKKRSDHSLKKNARERAAPKVKKATEGEVAYAWAAVSGSVGGDKRYFYCMGDGVERGRREATMGRKKKREEDMGKKKKGSDHGRKVKEEGEGGCWREGGEAAGGRSKKRGVGRSDRGPWTCSTAKLVVV